MNIHPIEVKMVNEEELNNWKKINRRNPEEEPFQIPA